MVLGGLAKDESMARAALSASLASGAAADRFARMVASLDGPADLVEKPDVYLAQAPVVVDVPASRDGVVTAIDTRALGLAVVALGGGRTAPGQAIDPAVGLDQLMPRGTRVRKDQPVARVHAADRDAAAAASVAVADAYEIGATPPSLPPLVERIT
jgi:thymidine phosphorylase